MSVYAVAIGAGRSDFYVVRTVMDQGSYTIRRVPPGTYHLLAVPTDGFGQGPQHFIGGYTRGVQCLGSANCTDHSLIDVSVGPAQSVSGIDVVDFYAGTESYPLVPGHFVVPTPIPSAAASYLEASAAALFESWRATHAAKVISGTFDACPVNEACIALQAKHDGTRSAYFVAQAGSNADTVTCGVYVFQDSAGWHPLNTACGTYPAPGRTVSATFMGSGCINVRANPGYTGKIVECLPVDSKVTIDAGPVFVEESTASDAANLNRLWWHLVGHGWMVHQYLTFGSFN